METSGWQTALNTRVRALEFVDLDNPGRIGDRDVCKETGTGEEKQMYPHLYWQSGHYRSTGKSLYHITAS